MSQFCQRRGRRGRVSDSHKNKDSRWDRIRKRYTHTTASHGFLKSKAVRHFLEMDYVGSGHDRVMRGVISKPLNPLLIMDMRHGMKREVSSDYLPLATVAHIRNINKCVEHNALVENHYIDYELHKFRTHLEKQYKRTKIDKHLVNGESLLRLDNDPLRQSVKTTAALIHDFYAAPIEALKQAQQLMMTPKLPERQLKIHVEPLQLHEISNLNNEETAKLQFHRRTPSPLTPTEELLRPMHEAAGDLEFQKRFVYIESPFVKEIVLCKRGENKNSSRSSNTSDGIDSVISELAEEALRELRMEEEVEPKTNLGGNTGQKKMQIQHVKIEAIEQNDPDLLIVQGYHVPAMTETMQTQLQSRMYDSDNQENENGDEDNDNDKDNESMSCHEQNEIIAELFRSCAQTNATTLRRYFFKWLHFTTIAKIEREHCNSRHDRIHMINAFLDKIRREKVRLSNSNKNQISTLPKAILTTESNFTPGVMQATKKYQNKIKVQQDIIDLQRIKIERQERMITELKLSKLSEEAREARQELKDELKTIIRIGDAKTKVKAKCLNLMGTRHHSEDGRLQAQGALLVPKFLQAMQERSLERSIRHEQARQRRLQKEAEREAMKIAAEEAKRLEDEEAKCIRIEALREKRRQEKLAKIQKERERQRMLELNNKAHEFYRHFLLHRIGLEVFRRLLQKKRNNQLKCEIHLRQHFQYKYFIAWKQHCALLHERKNTSADDFYERTLKRKILNGWQEYMQYTRSQFHVAIDWHDLHLTEKYFVRWYCYTQRLRAIEEAKICQAISHHEWHLKWKVLDCWQRLPQLLQLEKETEERRQRWRMKIWELLPDYSPNRDELLWN